MSEKLILAVPSKGRLKEQCETYFREAGMIIRQTGGSRGYAAELNGVDGVELRLMSASEIAKGVIGGDIHLGVTGEDLLRETAADLDKKVRILKPLGFGFARLIVAAPASWIDVETMADLDEVGSVHQERTGRRMRVATKYMRLAREFFAAKGVGHYRIVESAGATEGAPASGAADLIVDITTTGATLSANGLKIVSDGEILASQAVLGASRNANWTDQTRQALRAMLDYIEARQRAKGLKTLQFGDGVSEKVLAKISKRHGLIQSGAGQAFCPSGSVTAAAQEISRSGGGSVSVYDPEFVFEAENPVYEGFETWLSQSL